MTKRTASSKPTMEEVKAIAQKALDEVQRLQALEEWQAAPDVIKSRIMDIEFILSRLMTRGYREEIAGVAIALLEAMEPFDTPFEPVVQ